MLVAISREDNNIYNVVDSVTREFKRIKKSSKKDSFYYSLLETENHIVGLDDPNVKYMLLSIEDDGACIVDVSSNNLCKVTLFVLEQLIRKGCVGNLRHNDKILDLSFYTKNKDIDVKISIEKEYTEEIKENTEEKIELTDEYYRKHRIIRFIIKHNSEYTEIESIDYIKINGVYEIYHSSICDDAIKKELVLGDISNSNIEYELVKVERKYGRWFRAN